jgi:hypothetical protein
MRRDPPTERKIALAIDIRQAFELGGKPGSALSASPNMGSIEVDHGPPPLMWCALVIAPNPTAAGITARFALAHKPQPLA